MDDRVALIMFQYIVEIQWELNKACYEESRDSIEQVGR